MNSILFFKRRDGCDLQIQKITPALFVTFSSNAAPGAAREKFRVRA
jgi:hypothetical protein